VHFQRLVSVVKMATVLEGVLPKISVLLCFFCGQKDSMLRIFIKKCFLVYGGKCLSRKAVHSWVEKFSQGCSKVADDETELRKWLRQESKHFYAAGFDALVKQWNKCINVGGGSDITCFTFYIHV
jgi:hypothetical protein